MSATDGFWSSLAGIFERIKMLAHDAIWGTVNDTTKEIASSAAALPSTDEEQPQGHYVPFVVWQTMEDPRVCDECDSNAGTYNPEEEVLPDLPCHSYCRCWLEPEPQLVAD
jgi:hypothetical protein